MSAAPNRRRRAHRPSAPAPTGPRIAVVTGGTRGIGLAVADALAASGYSLVLNYRSDAAAAAAAQAHVARHGNPTTTIRADIADPTEVDRLFATLRADVGPIDAFVSNAGVTADGFAVMMSQDKWDRVLSTNLDGAFTALRHAARGMAGRRRGALLAIASTSALNAPPGQTNYAASKAGLVAAVRVLAKELGPYGVRANSLLPGFVDTDMARAVPADAMAAHLERLPLGRLGTPDEVGAAAAFLLSDAAAYITGASLVVDGGLTS